MAQVAGRSLGLEPLKIGLMDSVPSTESIRLIHTSTRDSHSKFEILKRVQHDIESGVGLVSVRSPT